MAGAVALFAVNTCTFSSVIYAIARWRRDQSLALTARRRPELIAAARAEGRLSAEDEKALRSLAL